MSAEPIILPEFTYRDVESAEFMDTADRMVDFLSDLEIGLPPTDATNRELVQDADDSLTGLAARMGIDRKGKFTAEKQAAEKSRRSHASSLMLAARTISTDPRAERPADEKAAAARIRKLFSPHLSRFARKSSAQRSTALRLLFECAKEDAVQADLETAGLMGYFDLLVSAHDAYLAVFRKEGLSEAENDAVEAAAEDAEAAAPVIPGTSRELKASATESLNLAFTLIARHARKGRQPYARLLARCAEIANELNVLNKSRETRAKNAKAKKDAKAAAKDKDDTNANRPAEGPSVATPAAASREQEPVKAGELFPN